MKPFINRYNNISNQHILIIILVISAILRFYNFFEIPFTHDEFSALFRTYFSSFSELIEYGVKTVDTHPAGVQVFLYYYTRIFGEAEWVVKLPFLISGILAVFLIYKIGKLWFNETVGLISAAFLASLQYPIMHSQIARPYGSGIFLSLAMVWFWTLLIKNNTKLIRNSIFYALFASLCTYNHYFSLLFAGIVAVTGFFIIDKNKLLKYLFANIAIAILFIPHINIFIAQLNMKGIEGWLAKPTINFWGNYLAYIFHFSIFCIALVIVIFSFSCIVYEKKSFKWKNLIIFSIWFILPIIIGYFYSVYVNAVLQYSVLIFSFPFLFFIIFGHIKNLKPYLNLIIVISILTVNILTLIYSRDHYKIFYESSFKKIITEYVAFRNQNPEKPAIIESHKKITDYYLKQLEVPEDFAFIDKETPRAELIKLICEMSKNNDILYLGCTSNIDPIAVPLIMDYLPKIESQNNYFGGTTYIFSKNGQTQNKFISFLDFSYPYDQKWEGVKSENISTDSLNNYIYNIYDYMEWSPSYTINFDSLTISKYDFIDISVEAFAKQDLSDVFLVASFESNGKNIYYTASDFSDFKSNSNKNHYTNIHLSLKLSDINLNFKNIIIKIYLWNRGKNTFNIDNFKISIRKGNPIIYSLTNRI
ncbi:MAG TPA: glycosyltransferase family 39 protein [Bacteroidales bacterium]|nr:glycosyltransferase family 39 protein [Bacteroidales bacterium]